MRILILFNRYIYRGGEDTYVENLIALLKKKGHSVYLYEKDSRSIKSPFDKVKVGLGLFWNRTTENELSKIIREFKPQVAHFHNIYPSISPTAYRVCEKNKILIVQTIHNYKFVCPKNSLFRNGSLCELCVGRTLAWPSILYGCYHKSRLSSLIYSFAFLFHKTLGTFHKINRYIFPTDFVRDYYCKHVSFISQDKTIVLPHPSPFKTQSSPSTSKKKYPYVYIGRLSEEKGVIPLVSLFKENQKPLQIVGSGPLKGLLKKSSKSFKNIVFTRHVPQVHIKKIMKTARAIIIPSLWYEVLPLVLLEALALGKTVFLPNNKNLGSIKGRNNIIYFNSHNFSDLKKKMEEFESESKKRHIDKMPKIYGFHYHYIQLMKIYETHP